MHAVKQNEKGNALIYVLIAIALFAALSMTFGRQSDTGEANALSGEKAELYATQLINYAAQAKAALDQMRFSGAKIDNIDFTLPNEAGFNAAPNGNKVYHPSGGGLTPGNLAIEVAVNSGSPPSGWYMGRFNNVEWTKTAGQEIILTAYDINVKVCGLINKKITGSDTIPELNGGISETLLDGSLTGIVNTDLTTDPSGSPVCPECDKRASLCVKDGSADIYAFYNIIALQ